MRLYDLLNNEGTKLEKEDLNLIKKLYEDKGKQKHFIFENAIDITTFLAKYNIKILNEETGSKIYKKISKNIENFESLEGAFYCDLFRTDEDIPTFELYFKVNHLYNICTLLNEHGWTYQIKNISFQ